MSSTSDVTTSPPPLPPDRGPAAEGRPAIATAPWAWMLVSCALLGGSVAVREWQDQRFRTKLETVVTPFQLKSLPYILGDWHAKEGEDATLDPDIVKMIGATDHIVREYVNELTGVKLSVMVTFGRAESMVHLPEVCMPSSGFTTAEAASFHAIDTGRGKATFRSEVFAKGPVREEVYYSFRHNARWSPSANESWKLFRVSPSMFKVQVQRRVVEHERRDVNNPTEQFLAVLLPQIEGRLPGDAGSSPPQTK
jgi:hypothetical protein